MRVKICGITRPQDAIAAEQAGVDAIGLNFVKASRRYITLAQAKQISEAVGPFIQQVGVFANSPLEEVRETARVLRLDAVQLHGQEDEIFAEALRHDFKVIKAVSFQSDLSLEALKAFPADAILLDGLKPGSGEPFDWQAARYLSKLPNLILAGGITRDNMMQAVATFNPYALDLASGVESSPGIKDPQRLQDFVRLAKAEDLSTVIHSSP